ncbi:MAG: alkaline phosphatase [Bacteroidetes bacterium]|nr:alkaline phosphatase [Bacteroidota bacterium]
MNKSLVIGLFSLVFLGVGCKKTDLSPSLSEQADSFVEVGSIDIGDAGAAEISAYDPITKRLFAVNHGIVNKIDVIDLEDPTNPKLTRSIPMAPYGGFANSLDVSGGRLAVAIEAAVKQDPGKVVIFDTRLLFEIKAVTVGALPDMVTFSPDGNWILTANEGEPSNDYQIDPEGTISIIDVRNGFLVSSLDFKSFVSQRNNLVSRGMRISGPNGNFEKDIEPEYVAISEDSKKAFVTLQENNAIARIDIASKTIESVFPLGSIDFSKPGYEADFSDRDGRIAFASWPVRGYFMPDGIASMEYEGETFLFTANEGDAREYSAFNEMRRVNTLTLDPARFPNAALLRTDAQLGRLNVTRTAGDIDFDGDYDSLYTLNSRSFSVWNGQTGALVFDSKNELDTKCNLWFSYDDARSDDKGSEPEGVALGTVGGKKTLFVGLERSDAVAVYDVSNPRQPVYLKLLACGDAPEGLLFIGAKDNKLGRSLLVVSSENDGIIKIFATK